MSNTLEYYDMLSSNTKLRGMSVGKESFATPPSGMAMSTDISGTELQIIRSNMLSDKDKYDYSDKVNNPYGYGYTPSLIERRNQDSKDIQEQQTTMFALGAVTGVSLIVIGILLTSSADISPTVPA
jgi:hypothetical protein